MFVFSNNGQLKKEFKKIVIDEGVTMAEVARRCEFRPQQLNNRFNNYRVSFNDLKMFLDVVGYDLQIEFVKR